MIDISDGLSVDLSHICEESRVGAEIELDRLPISAALRRSADNPLRLALGGGEDFELLFTVKKANIARVLRLAAKFEITLIGRVTVGKRLVAVDASGRKEPLAIRGWEHFRSGGAP
jgi:thiamine-monophosphate kinase